MVRDRVFNFLDKLIKLFIIASLLLFMYNTYQASRTYKFTGTVIDTYIKPLYINGKNRLENYVVIYNDSLKEEVHVLVDDVTYSRVYSKYKYYKVNYSTYLTKAELFMRPDYFFLITEKHFSKSNSVVFENFIFVLFYILLLIILNIIRNGE